MYKDYQVQLIFNDGSGDYILPYIQNISDPVPGMKANVIQGVRADGSIVIPGGKRSIDIDVKGTLWTNEGYADLVSQLNTLRATVTTLPATLTLQHFDTTLSGGGDWVIDWSFAVRRIDPITFDTSMRTERMDYNIRFFVTGY